jgi:hypothetical protein
MATPIGIINPVGSGWIVDLTKVLQTQHILQAHNELVRKHTGAHHQFPQIKTDIQLRALDIGSASLQVCPLHVAQGTPPSSRHFSTNQGHANNPSDH